MTCPQCQAAVAVASNFCEDCGARLKDPETMASGRNEACEGCGAGPETIDADGYCASCGIQRRHPERDHLELAISTRLAGTSDRGLKHYRNEDFLAAAETPELLLAVVCDGVSNSQNADAASASAAPSMRDAFLSGWSSGGNADPEAVFRTAIAAAHDSVLAVTAESSDLHDPPETTIVAAALIGAPGAREAVAAWLGDSRAYFIGATAALQLTTDHSWLVETLAAGKMTYSQAIRCKGAHSITRTLGGFPAEEGTHQDEPSVIRARLPEPGWVILCSDGLWNYAPDLADFAALVRRAPPSGHPLDLSRELVAWARLQGGKDNITVVVMKAD